MAGNIQDKAASESRDLNEGETKKIGDLTRGVESLNKDVNALEYQIAEEERQRERQIEYIHSIAGNPRNVEAGSDPGITDRDGPPRTYAAREASLRSVDRIHERGEIHDEAAKRAEDLVRKGTRKNREVASKWISVTADPAYSSAFAKIASDPERGFMTWTREEQDAFQRVEEFRAMSLTTTAGGFLVPFQLDPAIILTSAGSINPLRQISRVVTATGDVWHGVSSAGVTAEVDQ